MRGVALALVLVLAACGSTDLATTTTAKEGATTTTAAGRDDESLVCEPAPLRVTILPWLEPGEPLPEPEVELNVDEKGSSILTWEGPPGTSHEGARGHVAIVRYPMSSPLGGPGHPVDIPVRGTLGEIQWVGDPGVGEVRLAWLEDDGNCGFYALYLWDITLTEEESEQYLREAGASLIEP